MDFGPAQFWDWDELPGENVYTEEHRAWRAQIRRWMDNDIIPNIDDWEENGDLPKDLAKGAYDAGRGSICGSSSR